MSRAQSLIPIPILNRGEGQYKEAVDKSLAKIARTSFGRDLIESMNEQGIEITMPSDHTTHQSGDHDHDPSVGNYANPDKIRFSLILTISRALKMSKAVHG